MNLKEAKRIFNVCWRPYIEIHDKFRSLNWTVPRLLLPFPNDDIEEIANLIAKDYFDNGDKKKSDMMQVLGVSMWLDSDDNSDSDLLSGLTKFLEWVESEPIKLKRMLLEKLVESDRIFSKDKVKICQDMSLSDAARIIETWNNQLEFNEKIEALNWYLPDLFLPYSKELIIMATKKITKKSIKSIFYKSKNQDMPIPYLDRYIPYDESITIMCKNLRKVEDNPELKKDILDRLSKVNDKWLKLHDLK